MSGEVECTPPRPSIRRTQCRKLQRGAASPFRSERRGLSRCPPRSRRARCTRTPARRPPCAAGACVQKSFKPRHDKRPLLPARSCLLLFPPPPLPPPLSARMGLHPGLVIPSTPIAVDRWSFHPDARIFFLSHMHAGSVDTKATIPPQPLPHPSSPNFLSTSSSTGRPHGRAHPILEPREDLLLGGLEDPPAGQVWPLS